MILSMRTELESLRMRLAEVETAMGLSKHADNSRHPNTLTRQQIFQIQPNSEYSALRALYEIITSAPPDVVASTVAQARNRVALEDIIASTEKRSQSSSIQNDNATTGINRKRIEENTFGIKSLTLAIAEGYAD
jgi:hypothetical protein